MTRAPKSLPVLARPTLSGAIPDVRLRAALDRTLGGREFDRGCVLIQIPQVPLALLDRQVAKNRGYFAYPPQGLLYLSAALGKVGVKSEIIDLNYTVLREVQKEGGDVEHAWQSAVDRSLSKFDRPWVCVSFMFDPTYPALKAVCEFVKARRPDACVAVGGVAATSDPGRILDEELCDVVFSHEGEHTIEQFYAYVRGETTELPPNLSFLAADGEVLSTASDKVGTIELDIKDEYEKIPIRDYHRAGSLSNYSRMNGLEVPFATVQSRRGCRAKCSFCSVRGFNGKGVRVRGAEGVVAEMEVLYRKGIRHFDWLDDDLLYDADAAVELFDKMADKLPAITWAANNGLIAAAITPRVLESMEKSGCIGFKVGLESGNSEVLRRVHKPTSLDKFFEFPQMARQRPRMFVAVIIILGFPGERFGQMLD